MENLNVLVMIPTTRCNMECEYCFNKLAQNFPKNQVSEMSFLTAKSIIDEYLKKDGQVDIQFTGGEPLLRQDLIEQIWKAYPNQKYMLFSNGSLLLNESLMRNFPRELLVSISLDFPDQVPPLYNQLLETKARLFSVVVIDLENIDFAFRMFQKMLSLQFESFSMSPNYLETYSQEKEENAKQLGRRMGIELKRRPNFGIDKIHELDNYLQVNQRGLPLSADSHLNVKVLRFSSAGNPIDAIATAHINEAIQSSKRFFPHVHNMSRKLELGNYTFEPGKVDSVANPCVFYACTMFEEIRKVLYGGSRAKRPPCPKKNFDV